MEDREAWYAVVQGLQSQTQLSETTRNQLQGKTKIHNDVEIKKLNNNQCIEKKILE